MAIYKRYKCSNNNCKYTNRTSGLCPKCKSDLVPYEKYTIQYTDKTGKKHTQTVGNKATAQIVLNKKLTEIAEDRFLNGIKKNITFETVANEYLDEVKEKKSYERYVYAFKHLNKFFNKTYISNIKDKDVKEYKAYRLKQEVSNGKLVSKSTVGREITIFKTMFKYAELNRYVTNEQLLSMRNIKNEGCRQVNHYITDEQRQKLLNELTPNLRSLIKFILHTGTRLKEATTLQWKSVDIDNKVAHLQFTKTSKENEIQILHLSATAIDILSKLSQDTDYVFMNELTNTRWKSPLATFKRAAKRAGLIYDDGIFRIHDLRHAFCTRAAERNIPIQTITTLARHKDPRSTMRYIHHSNKYLQSSLAQMDD